MSTEERDHPQMLVAQCPGCWSIQRVATTHDHECECGERLTVIDLRAGVTLASRESPDPGVREIIDIVRRHTHQGIWAMTSFAGPAPEDDCHLCRALVAAGVLTVDQIGAGTRAALSPEPTPEAEA